MGGEDGLIGADVFAAFLVDIDFPNQKLHLGELPKRPGELLLPRATGLFPDGLAFEIPDSDPAPPARSLEQAFETRPGHR